MCDGVIIWRINDGQVWDDQIPLVSSNKRIHGKISIVNITLDPSSIFNGLIGSLFLIVAVMIKHELLDIKNRLTRLEDVFIKPIGKD